MVTFIFHLAIGPVPSPFDCYLVNRGMKTLHVRMLAHQKNGLAVANFLESNPRVEKVLHPGKALISLVMTQLNRRLHVRTEVHAHSRICLLLTFLPQFIDSIGTVFLDVYSMHLCSYYFS